MTELIVGLVYLLLYGVLGAIYFAPTIIAFRRQHPNRWLIFLLNLLFGATVIGWIAALVWALNAFQLGLASTPAGDGGVTFSVNNSQRTDRRDGRPTHSSNPPLSTSDTAMNQLARLKQLHSDGVLDDEEYQRLRQPCLDQLMAKRDPLTTGVTRRDA